MVNAVLFCAAYFAAIELGRLTTGQVGLPLFAPAPPLLLFTLLLTPNRTRAPRMVAAAGVHVLSALVHRDAVSSVSLDAGASLLGATVSLATCTAWGVRIRESHGVTATWRLLVAASLAAVTAASIYAIPRLAAGDVAGASDTWTARLVTNLMGIVMFAPLAMAGLRQVRITIRDRRLEFAALIIATAAVTHVAWASSEAPRPALLAPLYVWAAARFQLVGSIVGVIFEGVALGNSLSGRGPWAHAQTLADVSVALWLQVIASATFLLLSAGVLERRRTLLLAARVLDGVHDGIVVIDAHGRITTVNRAAAQMFALPAGVAGRPVQDLLSPSVNFSAASHGEMDLEVVATRADGTVFPARVSLSPVASDDERHVLAVVRDLSHQRDTERSLEMSEAQLRAVLAALPDLILIHDRHGHYVGFHVSPHGLGYAASPATHLDRSVTELLSPSDAAALDAARQRVLATRTPEFFEFSVTQGGRTHWLESRLVPLGDDRTLSVLRDVTDRRQLQDQLRQAQKLEAIGRLAGGVAHDFNNLLTVIGGSTELVLDTLPAADRHRRLLQEVREATARAALLTQQLLAFGRRQVLQAELFEVGHVVRGCERMLARLIGEHIHLSCVLQEAVPLVRADRGQIEQVIVNLVINARDAMPSGGQLAVRTACVTFTEDACRADRRLRPGCFVSLSVADTGSGIPPEVIEHIFEPFYTTKATGRGTGLGLATVYGIVQQSGGFITVDSLVDAGSTFTVYLPAVEAQAVADPPSLPPRPAEQRGQETVLLVEDETAVRDIAVRFLTNAGYRVLAAANGQDALTIAGSHEGPMHVLLTDVVMPGMSGPELATALKQRDVDMRVIFMSGYPNDALVAHQMPDDSSIFIQKPFSRQSLMEALRASLGPPVGEP